jgi:hypothetical protein
LELSRARHARALLLALLLSALLPRTVAGSSAQDDRPCAANDIASIDLIKPALLSGPLHRVAPCARIVGHMARFRIDTRWGPLEADSIELLRLRVEETTAIEMLERTGQIELARAAATDRLARTARSLERVTTRPLETARELPAGAMRFLATRTRRIVHRAERLGDRGSEALTGAGDAYAGTSARPGVAGSGADRTEASWWQRGASATASAARDWIGYDDARRDWARRLGVDPYSRNPLLDERLDTLAWYALSGGSAVGLGLGSMSGAAGEVLGAARRVDRMVWALPAADLAERNRQRLAAQGCAAPELRRFLRNREFTPALQSRLTDAVVELAPTRGCTDLIDLAAGLETEVEARYLIAALELLAARSAHGDALELIATSPVLRRAALPRPQTGSPRSPHGFDMRRTDSPASDPETTLARASGNPPPGAALALPLPVDYLRWTAATQEFFDRREFRVVDKQLILAGRASPRALRELTRRGWTIDESHAAFGEALR